MGQVFKDSGLGIDTVKGFQLGPLFGLAGADEGEDYCGEEGVAEVICRWCDGLVTVGQQVGLDDGFETGFLMVNVHNCPPILCIGIAFASKQF